MNWPFPSYPPTPWTAKQIKPADHEAITAIKEALAQPEQEPVAKVCHDLDGHIGWNPKLTQLPDEGTLLYTTPPQHSAIARKPLTLDKLWRVFTRSGLSQFHQRDGVVEYKYEKCIEEFARAIEAAHGITKE